MSALGVIEVATFGGAVVAGAVGGVHCVAMCGPLAGLVGVEVGRRGRGSVVSASITYQLGRLITYVAMGSVAAAVGAVVMRSAAWLAWANWVAAVVTAGALLGAGLLQFKVGGSRIWQRLTGKIASWLSQVALTSGGRSGAALAGMASGLLPCGMLWAFVLAAAATGSTAGALAVMTGLWVGSLPWLAGAVWAATSTSGHLQRLGRHGRKAVGIALIVLAAVTLAQRWPKSDTQRSTAPVACPHHSAIQPATSPLTPAT